MLIEGVVRDRAGHPAPGARVFFTAGPGSFPDVAAVTDGDGRFVLTAPSPGDYTVQSQADDGQAARTTVTVRADDTQVELRLSPEAPGQG
ncbi:carboxypeptidase-like regulatory domain-containing protein [Spirillospora sp. NPDC048911]|uniref:carboxypeptidase-like regulatory domain-containing protein n=1 Tax=Spirillospora sp. NPDC048911 TaxID=3364527 RepID=UPI00371FC821